MLLEKRRSSNEHIKSFATRTPTASGALVILALAAIFMGIVLWRAPIGIASSPAWSERGPSLGGRLSAVVPSHDLLDLPMLLVASPGGGVWRIYEGAVDWKFPKHFGMGDFSFTHLEWDIHTPGRLYGVTWNGLYATTDNGNSWTALINSGGVPAPLLPDQNDVVDPKPFAQSKFAVFASPPCTGLWYSFDGKNFKQHWPFGGFSKNLDNCLGTIAVDPLSNHVYFSTLARDGNPAHVFRSTCAWAPNVPCLKWQLANNNLPANTIVSTLLGIGFEGIRLVAQMNVPGNPPTSTYVTKNGLEWTFQSKLPSPPGVDTSPRALLYTGSLELLHGNVFAYHSNDLGKTWNGFNHPKEHADVRALFADPKAGKVWKVTDGSGADGSQTNVARWEWTPGSTPAFPVFSYGTQGLTVWQAYYAGVVVSGNPANPRRAFVGSQDNEAICSDTLGQVGWTTSGAASLGGDSFAFQFAPSDSNRAYAWGAGVDPTKFIRTFNASTLSSSCGDVKWETVKPNFDPSNNPFLIPPRFWSRNAIAIHPTDPDRLYFALQDDIGVCLNAGSMDPNNPVTVTHRPLPNNYQPTVVYVDGSGTIYAGTVDHGAYKSDDNGQSWVEWGINGANGASPALVTAIKSSSAIAPATFWMATTSGLYKGTPNLDGTVTWNLSVGGGGYIVSDVELDPQCPTRVYAAYGFGGWRAQHRGGIDFTPDNGLTWKSITSGTALHQGPVTDVQVDPADPTKVYAASFGRGFWVYDWGGSLPAVSGCVTVAEAGSERIEYKLQSKP